MLWLYRITSKWEKEKIEETDVYFYNLEEERDVNDPSHWLAINSVEGDIENSEHMIAADEKLLKEGKEVINFESVFLDQNNEITTKKKDTINIKDTLKKRKEILESEKEYYKELDSEDGYEIDSEEFEMTVKDNFTKEELLEWIKLFISEVFDDSSVELSEGIEADFAGTNRDSVMEIVAKAKMKEIEDSGILDKLKNE